MRREDFTLHVRDVGDAGSEGQSEPTVVIDFEGPAEELRDRISDPEGDVLADDQTDVALRLLSPLDDEGEEPVRGVVSVTDRVTGDFVLELNEEAEDVLEFIRAARRYGEGTDGEGRYRVRILVDGEELVSYEKRTFLVYNADGELLRGKSLIPGGVEL